MNIGEEIKNSFKKGSKLTQLIYINLGVFIGINILIVLFFFFNAKEDFLLFVKNWLMVPADLSKLIVRPWTVFSYQFLHVDFWHILFNILWLYWFGRVFLQYFSGKKLVGVYLLGGIAGALFYILSFNIFPVFQEMVSQSHALGASAAVMAIAIGISFYKPDYTFNLIFIGPVKIKYIALFFLVTDIMTIPLSNSGGHIAHLGGAFLGYIFVLRYRQGKDMTRGINNLLDSIFTLFKPRPKMKVHYRKNKKGGNIPKDDWDYNKQKKEEQEEIDRILDKIAKSGYNSLSSKEKEKLFRAGK